MLYRKDTMNKELEDLIVDNSNLIYSIISRYQNYYDKEDLYQIGVIGMIKAYKKYDPQSTTKFTTYAYTYILGEVLKYVNENKSFKLSKEYLAMYKKINEAKTILTQRLMKIPTNFELSIFLEIDEKVIDHIEMVTREIDRLDRIINEDGKNLILLDTIKDDKAETNIDSMMLYEEINKLTNDEKLLLKERYFLDKTQSETAKILGINQVQVSRNEQKILKKLKNNLCKVA